MAKANPLDAKLAQLPDRKRGGRSSWKDRTADTHPDFWRDEVLALVDRFLSGDPAVTRKLPTESSVCEWLRQQLAEKGVNVSANSVGDLFRDRKAAMNGKS